MYSGESYNYYGREIKLQQTLDNVNISSINSQGKKGKDMSCTFDNNYINSGILL